MKKTSATLPPFQNQRTSKDEFFYINSCNLNSNLRRRSDVLQTHQLPVSGAFIRTQRQGKLNWQKAGIMGQIHWRSLIITDALLPRLSCQCTFNFVIILQKRNNLRAIAACTLNRYPQIDFLCRSWYFVQRKCDSGSPRNFLFLLFGERTLKARLMCKEPVENFVKSAQSPTQKILAAEIAPFGFQISRRVDSLLAAQVLLCENFWRRDERCGVHAFLGRFEVFPEVHFGIPENDRSRTAFPDSKGSPCFWKKFRHSSLKGWILARKLWEQNRFRSSVVLLERECKTSALADSFRISQLDGDCAVWALFFSKRCWVDMWQFWASARESFVQTEMFSFFGSSRGNINQHLHAGCAPTTDADSQQRYEIFYNLSKVGLLWVNFLFLHRLERFWMVNESSWLSSSSWGT